MTRKVLLCSLLALAFSGAAQAETIKSIVLENQTLDLVPAQALEQKAGELDEREIRALGVFVTEEYRRRGYTTSFVESLVIRGDGVLVIRVRESRLLGVSVSGVDRRESADIAALVMPRPGEVYNRYVIQERLEAVRSRFRLAAVTAEPLNYEQTADVLLSVKARKRGAGRFYGRLGVDPVYVLSPELGFLRAASASSVNLEARAGYRDGEFRKIEGEGKFTRHINREGSVVLLLGARGGRRVERWETPDRDYIDAYAVPYGGVGFINDLFGNFVAWTHLTLQGRLDRVEDYGGRDLELLDAGLALDMVISDKYYLLEKRDATGFSLKAYGGRSELRNDYQASVESGLSTSWSPFYRLRLVPALGLYYTSSPDRLHWRYVYDARLLGFFGDYTAARWKNTAGLDVEMEIAPRLFYAGPFVNTGFFLDEEERWDFKTGTGLKAVWMLKNLDLTAYYGWDLEGGPADGGLYLSADGYF